MISEPNVGDIVLIHDDKLKRQQWRIGKVTRTIISADGKIRACELKVNTGFLKRPVNKLYPFEYKRVDSEKDQLIFVDDKDTLTFLAVGAGV